jgi:outer membrane receptor protein involved in Fe transport
MTRLTRSARHPLTLALAAALLLPVTPLAFAQQSDDDDDATSQEDEREMDQVVVTGSRIKRAEIEGPAPVTVISREQLEREGFVTVADALETITQASGSTQNDLNSAGGFTPNAAVINLRGLGPGRTLLLVNGRRAADYPFPYNGQSNFQNFNNIPAGAVERIEILAGGASAIYGSDAVAGVVNVVLKTNYDGDSIKLRVQTSTSGGRDIGDLQWVGGRTGLRAPVRRAAVRVPARLHGFGRGQPVAATGRRTALDRHADPPYPTDHHLHPAGRLRLQRARRMGALDLHQHHDRQHARPGLRLLRVRHEPDRREPAG